MIADIAREDLWIISTKSERLAYAPANPINILSVAPWKPRDKTILVSRASKAPLRLSRLEDQFYALGPKALIAKMNTLQTHLIRAASSIAQWAAQGAVRRLAGSRR